MQLKKFGPAGILNWIDLIDAQGSSRYPGEIIPPTQVAMVVRGYRLGLSQVLASASPQAQPIGGGTRYSQGEKRSALFKNCPRVQLTVLTRPAIIYWMSDENISSSNSGTAMLGLYSPGCCVRR